MDVGGKNAPARKLKTRWKVIWNLTAAIVTTRGLPKVLTEAAEMRHGPKHRINFIKEDDRIIPVMEQRREQTQWRDVAVDQDRFDSFSSRSEGWFCFFPTRPERQKEQRRGSPFAPNSRTWCDRIAVAPLGP